MDFMEAGKLLYPGLLKFKFSNILYYNETTVAVTIKMIGVSIVNLFFKWFNFAEQLKAGVK